MMQRLLVSVRGANEAETALRAGAHIADVEYPASALGTPYPLNIHAVRSRLNSLGFEELAVSTNIGENQMVRSAACQAALGVAVAGADIVKFGLAEQTLQSASYLGDSIVRTVRAFCNKQDGIVRKEKILIPAVFVDKDMARFFDPFSEGPELAGNIHADGVLIDTYNKLIGKGLLDYAPLKKIAEFVRNMHAMDKEAWIAGSITLEELPELWGTGVDVICVRGAACEQKEGRGRFGEVTEVAVQKLVATLPASTTE